MNTIEKRMLEVLKELKSEFNIIGIKSEFEAEGTRTDEQVMLNEIIFRADLDAFIKVGGCEAVRDIDQLRVLGAKGIMAPMIETPFAMKKFVQSFKKVFGDNKDKGKVVIINMETITSFNNFDGILDEGEGILDSVCVGRVDFCSSLGLTRKEINSDVVFDYVYKTVQKVKERNMIATVGGGISGDAVPFIKKLGDYIDRFETRKVIFPVKEIRDRYQKALALSMEFEILYLKNKQMYYDTISKEDVARIGMLEARFQANQQN